MSGVVTLLTGPYGAIKSWFIKQFTNLGFVQPTSFIQLDIKVVTSTDEKGVRTEKLVVSRLPRGLNGIDPWKGVVAVSVDGQEIVVDLQNPHTILEKFGKEILEQAIASNAYCQENLDESKLDPGDWFYHNLTPEEFNERASDENFVVCEANGCSRAYDILDIKRRYESGEKIILELGFETVSTYAELLKNLKIPFDIDVVTLRPETSLELMIKRAGGNSEELSESDQKDISKRHHINQYIFPEALALLLALYPDQLRVFPIDGLLGVSEKGFRTEALTMLAMIAPHLPYLLETNPEAETSVLELTPGIITDFAQMLSPDVLLRVALALTALSNQRQLDAVELEVKERSGELHRNLA
jgi:hypothetical protein